MIPGAVKEPWRLFNKNIALCKPAMGSIECDT